MMNHQAIANVASDLALGRISAQSLAIAIRLEFANQFLTYTGFAESHGMTPEHAAELIEICRKIHESALTEST